MSPSASTAPTRPYIPTADATGPNLASSTQPSKPRAHTPSPLLPPSAVKAIQDLQQQLSDPIPIPRKSANPAAGFRPHPVARYAQLLFPNTVLPEYLLNQSGTVFTDSNFHGTQWSQPAAATNNETSVKFEGCDLRLSNFSHVMLDDCRWTHCDMRETNFRHCRFLRTARFVGCDLRHANFEGSKFYRLELVDCTLDGLVLRDVFVHTLTLDGVQTSLRAADVTNLLVANLKAPGGGDTSPTASSAAAAVPASLRDPAPIAVADDPRRTDSPDSDGGAAPRSLPPSPSPTTPVQRVPASPPLGPATHPDDAAAAAAAHAAARDAETALARVHQPPPLPAAELLHLAWHGAYFGAGATELHHVRGKLRRAAASTTPSAVAMAFGGGGEGYLSSSAASSVSSLASSPRWGGEMGRVAMEVVEPGWARVVACLRKIGAGDFSDSK
ncbi:hypothetical protein HDU96_005779 [Phlyctochytrium bullatum]|nr:hypothetical protein HDU96_005779 [Phlyctochytrium bullatum]